MEFFLENIFSILVLSSLYGIITVGFSLIYSVTKIMHLAQGVVVLASSYFFFTLFSNNVSLFISTPLTLIFAIILGWLLNFFIYEKIRGRNKKGSKGSLIASIALIFIFQNLIAIIFGSRAKVLNLRPQNILSVSGATLSSIDVLIIICAVASIGAVIFFMKKTKTGIALRATSDNETVTEVIGINTKKIRAIAFYIGSALAGLGGILFVLKFNLTTQGGVLIAIKAFSRAIIGGAGSIPGAIVGNLIIETTEHAGAWYTSSAYKNIFSFIIVFFFLLFLPRGIFGKKNE